MDIGFTTIRYKEACPPDYTPDYNLRSASEPGTDLPRIIGSAIQMFPDLRDVAVRTLMDIELRVRTDVEAEWRTPGETYSFHQRTRRRRELGLRRADFAGDGGACHHARCLSGAQKRAGRLHLPLCPEIACDAGLYAVRPDLRHRHRRHRNAATMKLIKLAAERLEAAGMPFTQHWGKTNNMTKARVRSAFGGNVDRWNATRALLLPNAAERNAFSSGVIDGLGLNV